VAWRGVAWRRRLRWVHFKFAFNFELFNSAEGRVDNNSATHKILSLVLGHLQQMNAHLNQPRLASIPPPATSTTNNRRNPLSNAINNQIPPQVPPKSAHYEKKASPPLPRQNAKIQPPSPPPVIQDKTGSLRYQRMSFLGEVGLSILP
jgi:hypothetical protein